MDNNVMAEYIWLDGAKPTAQLRSKTKILTESIEKIEQIPFWGFDGSSTEQAQGYFSDCGLKPVRFIKDPLRGVPHILVMCEVLNADGSPHPTNTRAILETIVAKFADQKPLFGVEQEYTLFQNDRPFGWPNPGFPEPQGKYYCGVGLDKVYGRPLVEEHMKACLNAGIMLSGINAEVMPAQWEFQVGPLSPLETADQLWLARWLLNRLGEDYKAFPKLDPKPVAGDWNGAGGHTNFSTEPMRGQNGIEFIKSACEKLKNYHLQHIAVYGAGNDQRLTGKHETCSIHEFRSGVGDRGASIRIPTRVATEGKGYLEDRRPAANLDPYQVFTAILETTCGGGFDPKKYRWA